MNGRTAVVRSTRAEKNAIAFQGGWWRLDSFVAREQTMRVIAGRGTFVPRQWSAKVEHGVLYDLIMADERELIGTFPKRQSALHDEEHALLLEQERAAYWTSLAGFMCPRMMQAMAKPMLTHLRQEHLQGRPAARYIAEMRQRGTCAQDMWAAGFDGERPGIRGIH